MAKKVVQKIFIKIFPRLLLYSLFTVINFKTVVAQTVIGMGTETPNPNAVLELFSAAHNQGFLAPRFTTEQRNASSFTSQLNTSDNGLLVFDTNEGKFFYWFDGKWHQTGYNEDRPANTSNWFAGNTTPDNSNGNDGDFYFNSTTGDIYRKKNGAYLIIGNVTPAKNIYTAGKGISINSSLEISNTGDLDNSNEIQNLELKNNSLSITNNPKANSIDLARYLDNTDQQQLSYNTGTQKLSLTNGGVVDLSTINTDQQDLQLNGNTLSLTNDATDVKLSATIPTNGQALKWNASQNRWEAQNDVNTPYNAGTGISINGSNQITNTKPDQPVSLTGTGSVSISGLYPNFTINGTSDGDSDDTNEIQDLSLNGNVLKLTNNTSATSIDLSTYLDNTDNQNLSLSGSSLTIDGGNSVDISSINTDSQTLSSSKMQRTCQFLSLEAIPLLSQ